jgi:2-dehydropantoate 2-reductase
VPVHATNDPDEIGAADHVLVTVKSFDTEAVATMLPALMVDDTAVVSLQNGVDNEEKLAAAVGPEHVVGGTAYIFATIAAPGVIEHTGGPARLVLGEWPAGRSRRVGELVATLQDARVDAEETDDVRRELWSKFAFICAQAGATAAVRLPIGEIRSHTASRQLFADLAGEVGAAAAAEGVAMPPGMVDRALDMADQVDPHSFSSLHHDLVHGRRMEIEARLGEVVRRGEQLRVDVPVSRAIYGVLQPWAARATHA